MSSPYGGGGRGIITVKSVTLLDQFICSRYYSGKRNNLYLGNLWRQDQSLVVSVHHHYDTDRPRRDSPRVLICVAHLTSLWILKRDVEHLGEVLAKVM